MPTDPPVAAGAGEAEGEGAGGVAAAASEGVSVSAWITEAARLALVRRDGLAAWEAEHGALTSEELAQARARVAEELRPVRRRGRR